MSITANAPGGVATAPIVSEGLARLVREQPELVVLLFEQWLLAVRDPELRSAFLARHDELRTSLAGALAARHETTGVPLAYPAERLAEIVIALGEGVAMAALIDPAGSSQELLGDALQLLYEGLEMRASRRG